MKVERGMLVASVMCLVRAKLQARQWLQDWRCSPERSCQLAMGLLSGQGR